MYYYIIRMYIYYIIVYYKVCWPLYNYVGPVPVNDMQTPARPPPSSKLAKFGFWLLYTVYCVSLSRNDP